MTATHESLRRDLREFGMCDEQVRYAAFDEGQLVSHSEPASLSGESTFMEPPMLPCF